MLVLLRHLFAILVLPVVMAILVPSWLLTRYAAVDSRWDAASALTWPMRGFGAILLLGGFVLFVWCVTLFARVGQGTLAPWDPTQRLVAVGPYRYARNPMITGVATVLAGWAAFTGSWVLALWLVAFVAFNSLYFVLVEEPGLEHRFGAPYREYKAHVPRWIPRP
ncbi:MAG TPA: isoprenylcysteine carboxylmethyltransferase family protein [Gemmatimonadaceae bacterium]|nr:isoprenylcysteine carboxylmethyltransferase family protein [Gemmatimonadaceae bacterium]